jgi:carbohydrate kinase (thermoresistant glucokinase family)
MVYFGRMLDKIRLHALGALPAAYHANLGDSRPNLFDARCCRFLGLKYAELVARVRAGGTDEEILGWALQTGRRRTDEECDVWSRYLMKLGWRDERSEALRQRVQECGLKHHAVETFFDVIDFDEGRDPVRQRSWQLRPTQAAIVMGVAGSGKSTVGHALANAMGWRFADGDDFHPPANIAKMRRGEPLSDEDRGPWLEALRAFLQAKLHEGESCVIACSALKASYREVLLVDPNSVMLVYLKGSREQLNERLGARLGHFMPPTLLDSQLAALEEPDPSAALVCDIANSPEQIVAQIRAALED